MQRQGVQLLLPLLLVCLGAHSRPASARQVSWSDLGSAVQQAEGGGAAEAEGPRRRLVTMPSKQKQHSATDPIYIIEAGANDGSWSATTFLELKNKTALLPADQRPKDLKCFMFEVQPKHLEGTIKTWTEKSGCVAIPKAVWITDGEKLKFRQVASNDQASTLISNDKNGFTDDSKDNMLTVETIDIARWMLETIPAGARVNMRMDIEGAEYQVMRRMIVSGAACLLDELNFEGHAIHHVSNYNKRPLDAVIPWLLKGCGVKTEWEFFYPEDFYKTMLDHFKGDDSCVKCGFLLPDGLAGEE